MTSTRKTIVFCCNTLWGLVNFRGRVIEALVRDGHRVVLVARRDVPVEQATVLGAEFVDWNISPRSANPVSEVMAIASLLSLYRRIRPDIAFQFTIKPVMYGAIVARLTGVRCLSVITGLGYLFLADNWKLRLAKILYRMTLHRSREVWFLNADDRSVFDLAGLTQGLQVRTLPGEGIDIGRFVPTPLPDSNGRFVFLMIARLVKDKGVLEYAEAARRVKAAYPQAVFRLLGPAYEAKGMSVPAEAIDLWSAEGRIDYLGVTDDVRAAIADCHCVVLPSYREGMPRVLMEAAAMGRPAIATNVAGCRDVVTDGDTGLLCEPYDADSLAKACIRMMQQDRNRTETMAARARQTVAERFDDRLVIDIYRRAIALADAETGHVSP
ncbi:galacturonosyltransferase [Burkholderiales bacterium]|nr:galacturonosyltransferase [Burkholderiales bacterium]